MKLFKSYKYAWWEIGVFKLVLLAIGAAIGAYWPEFFRENIAILIVIAATASAYVIYASLKQ